jgi:4-amino-4-deoxy-L-arabinose transferase-like glycosyltransferase
MEKPVESSPTSVEEPRLALAEKDRVFHRLALVGIMLLAVFFCVANPFHRYYLEMLAPAIAALVGAGVVALWQDFGRPGWRGWLLPLALAGGAAVEAVILAPFPDWNRWLTPLVVGLCVAAVLVLALFRISRIRKGWRPGRPGAHVWARVGAVVGMLALLFPMAVWSFTPLWYGGHAGLPYAGPDLSEEPEAPATQDIDRLVDYLRAHYQGETYLAATLSAQNAAPMILATGQPVMAMGGFNGGDPILSVEELVDLMAGGEVRYFLIPPQQRARSDLARWVTSRCTAVTSEGWEGDSSGKVRTAPLFDCAEAIDHYRTLTQP